MNFRKPKVQHVAYYTELDHTPENIICPLTRTSGNTMLLGVTRNGPCIIALTMHVTNDNSQQSWGGSLTHPADGNSNGYVNPAARISLQEYKQQCQKCIKPLRRIIMVTHLEILKDVMCIPVSLTRTPFTSIINKQERTKKKNI